MKILALGGAGHVGSMVVDLLINHSNVDIIIGDANVRRMAKLSEKYGNRISTTLVNADDDKELIKLMGSADLVISTIGPYYKYATKLIKAAIAAKTNFIDVDDDSDATKDSLDLDEAAKIAGVSVVIGCGATPGTSNLMAKAGADKLDKVDDIRIYWAQSGTDPAGNASIMHWFHIISEEVPQYIDGNWVMVKGFTGAEWFDFPILGRQETLYTGHAEPISLPRYIKGVKNVTIKGSVFPPSMLDIYKVLNNIGLGSDSDISLRNDFNIPVRELTVKMLRNMPRLSPDFFLNIYNEKKAMEEKANWGNIAGVVSVVVTGEKAGKKMTCRYDGICDDVNTITAAPLTAGALMMLNGTVKKKGVMAPEGALEWAPFLNHFNRLGISITLQQSETTQVM